MAKIRELTREGKKKFEEELNYLINVESVNIRARLSEARAQGDLSENADYDAARNDQAKIEARIKELQDILANSTLVQEKPRNTKKIALGATVVLKNFKNDTVVTYKIVNTVEANPFENLISQDCVLGAALINKSAGDIVEIKSIEPYKVEVLEIKYK